MAGAKALRREQAGCACYNTKDATRLGRRTRGRVQRSSQSRSHGLEAHVEDLGFIQGKKRGLWKLEHWEMKGTD